MSSGLNPDEVLHPAYMLQQGCEEILKAAFGYWRTVVPASTSQPVRMFAKRLALSAYLTHMYPTMHSVNICVDGEDDGAIAMLEAARWLSAHSSVQYMFGGSASLRQNTMRVNDMQSVREGNFEHDYGVTFHNPFAQGYDPFQLRMLQAHFAESAQYLRSEYGFNGNITALASIAGGDWPGIAQSLH